MSSPRIAAGAAIASLACFLTTPSSSAQTPVPDTPSTESAPPAPARPADPFGETVMLPQRKIVYLEGSATWDSAFETLVDALKSVYGYLDKEGIAPAGPALVIYTRTYDTGFAYWAAVPIARDPQVLPKGDLAVGEAPSGKALKFVHRGSYDAMDLLYEAIINHLDEKQLEAKDIFIEEYQTDPTKTPDDELVVHVLVPTR